MSNESLIGKSMLATLTFFIAWAIGAFATFDLSWLLRLPDWRPDERILILTGLLPASALLAFAFMKWIRS